MAAKHEGVENSLRCMPLARLAIVRFHERSAVTVCDAARVCVCDFRPGGCVIPVKKGRTKCLDNLLLACPVSIDVPAFRPISALCSALTGMTNLRKQDDLAASSLGIHIAIAKPLRYT